MSSKPAVYVEGSDRTIESMFLQEGWQIVEDPELANLICFSGGADVSPMLYGEIKHPRTHSDPNRDERCVNLFNNWVDIKPMVGICRGGQFLNVMSGGRMHQHVEGHTRSHMATLASTGGRVLVTSTHHQMMAPSVSGEVMMYADIVGDKDTEVVFYPDTICLCFQPHPEYTEQGSELRSVFFQMVEDKLGVVA